MNTEILNATNQFPNGFQSWMETYHEVATFMALQLKKEDSSAGVVYEQREALGYSSLYDLAKDWANEFEKLNEGREWDGEWWEEIEDFCHKKNSETN